MYKIIKIKYKPLNFFLMAYIFTWIPLFLLAYLSYQNQNARMHYIILMTLGSLGPFFSAQIMFGISDNRLRKDFFQRIFQLKRINVKFLPFVFFIMPLSIVLAILISTFFNEPIEQLELTNSFSIIKSQVVLSLLIAALVPIFEEMGWRGYGVDSLRSKFNVLKTSIFFGILWAFWHFPAFFIKGYYHHSLWEQNPIYAINFFVSVLPLALIMNWVYFKNNRSIILLMVFHIIVVFSEQTLSSTQFTKIIQTILLFIIAGIIILRDKDFFYRNDKKIE
ncbi:MAG: CPBP family intramembrane metalloprotease [Parachlamydiales bacterium]|nr:CPBP family intramembrane metalloprotease [Parachlamydiales bacterium]